MLLNGKSQYMIVIDGVKEIKTKRQRLQLFAFTCNLNYISILIMKLRGMETHKIVFK